MAVEESSDCTNEADAQPWQQRRPDVLHSIREACQDRGLQAGDQLPPIRELAERLEVKQSAVRDALLRAQTIGWVRILPRTAPSCRRCRMKRWPASCHRPWLRTRPTRCTCSTPGD